MKYALLALVALAAAPVSADDSDAAVEAAIRDAAAKVAPSVVLIETTGGTERISAGAGGPMIRKGVGPTTGLVVAADGYVITSAFNFANKPTAITVTVPDRKERFPAKIVATDHSRLLTLLRVEAANLPVPQFVPDAEITIGQWAIALGRTLDPNPEHGPSISVGIVSALHRVWGKMLQTDAKVSPVNYGGPLIAIDGRVLGVLVPASPAGDGETAGFEWYDSGIGFAVPLVDVVAVLPKLREGKDLKRGILGVTAKGSDEYGVAPTIGSVAPESAAAKAGMKPGDVITAIDQKPIANHAQVKHALGRKYEGDKVSVKVKRGKEELKFDDVVLQGGVAMFTHPFVGFLPLRDDPELGVGVRYVYPDSPAGRAGLKDGDRVMKIAPASAKDLIAFSGRDQFRELLDAMPAGTDAKIEVKRKEGGKTETLNLKLATLPDVIPDLLPRESSAKQALAPRKQVPIERPAPIPGLPKMPGQPKDKAEPKKEEPKPEEKPKEEPKKAETGLIQRPSPARDREYWMYVPPNYDPNVAHGLVIWLHGAGPAGRDARDLVDIWKFACEDHHLILVGPHSANESSGWVASEAEFIQETAREVMGQYTIDRQRVVTHGIGVGGQMAFYLAFSAREMVRGCATTGAALASSLKENIAGQRLSFFIVAGGKDPLAKDIAAAKPALIEKHFPVTFREVADMGKEYLDRKTFEELARWIDSLDRL